ncbi:MAG: AAA family ATPase [Mycobacterium sp.]|uniref:AAA family ATPase n=1 Tax=Mycobacterium sp. TaxID=1785 RepID=UPI00260233F4|nr:AAA family ATPase [Mycobacterium sp.]MDI3315516.1 AAA family ATPase [Mycobacterium sp.]
MKLHRLVLTNYRGITHREIDFPDHGVVVVSGANEIGKSSMIEALDLLLESKDRSTRKEVKQVKPTHADVGSEVVAEISSGPYRFIYRKRFHKKCETQLTVLAPRREQLTGDEAHERVRAMLAETVDIELWRAQRVLQAASTAAVDLSGCDALSRALDVAAGDAGRVSGAEPLLIERIDAEYARYFTPTGRPSGEWAAAISRLQVAEEDVKRWAAAVAEVDERVQRHAVLTDELAGLSQQQRAADARHAAARAAANEVAALTAELHQARLIATATAATSAAATAAYAERLRLHTEVDTRTASVAALQAEAQQAAQSQSVAREAAAAADAALGQAAAALAAAQQRLDSARGVVDQLRARDEAHRLSGRLDKIDAVQRDYDDVCAELSSITITEDLAHRIEDAAVAVDRAQAQLAAVSATVEITAAADIELTAEHQRVSLPAGRGWSTTITAATQIEIPGVLTARVIPGATALDIQAEYAAAQQDLTDALAAGEVATLAEARHAEQRRRDLQSRREQAAATLAGLCGDDQVDQLRSRLAQLRADLAQQPEIGTIDAAAARAELDAAEAARAAAAAECERRRQAATAAARKLAEASTRATLLQDKLTSQRAELDAAADRLAQQRAVADDAELASAADAETRAAQTAKQRVAELTELLGAAMPDAVAAELAAAAEAAEALRARHDEVSRALRELGVELAVLGSEGRKGKLDAAETAREHAAGEYARVGRRARAAELLRSVMARHRDITRLRYVEPFRAELHRLGRLVFGPTFEVDIDGNLRILTRTLAGRTVPYESLSDGAKEQLGILVRLAGAALIAKEDTVPVLIDDALGFADPDRLAKMGDVFDMMGAYGQVIVLTCTPARYQGVRGAHRIALSA